MNFDFFEEFKNLSNIDLLKIVLRPQEYTPEANDAAAKILEERQVSEDEINKIKNYYNDIDFKNEVKENKATSLSQKISEIVEPIIIPQNEFKPSYWVNVLLISLIIQYIVILFNLIKHFVYFFNCDSCHLSAYIFFQFASLLYIPIIFYLIFKKKKWAWILLFADNLFTILLSVCEIYLFFNYQEYYKGNFSSFVFSIIIRMVFLFFLWKKEITSYYGISTNIKKRTAIFTIIIALIFIIITFTINVAELSN